MVGPPTQLRAQRMEATREAITQAAITLFEREGFDDATVDGIAAEAGISSRTFFRYFPTKDDVLFTDHPERLARLRGALDARPAGEPILTSVREALLSLADHLNARRNHMVRMRGLMDRSPALRGRSAELQSEFAATVAAYVAERMGVDPVADQVPGLVASVVLGAVGAAVTTWLATGASGDLIAMVQHAVELLDEGLGLPDRAG